jgi:hypothetical protein
MKFRAHPTGAQGGPRLVRAGLTDSRISQQTGVPYAYPRYSFSNASNDIRAIFCEACDRLGVRWRPMNARNVSVARRESVALLDEFIGPRP